jgi:transketolase
MKPLAVLANTVKGKGVSFMEHQLVWHHSVPTVEQLEIARNELDITT